MRCYVNFDGFRTTQTGKRKVWQTDNIITFCCDTVKALFVWEKNTRHNSYNGYSGYVSADCVELIQPGA